MIDTGYVLENNEIEKNEFSFSLAEAADVLEPRERRGGRGEREERIRERESRDRRDRSGRLQRFLAALVRRTIARGTIVEKRGWREAC